MKDTKNIENAKIEINYCIVVPPNKHCDASAYYLDESQILPGNYAEIKVGSEVIGYSMLSEYMDGLRFKFPNILHNNDFDFSFRPYDGMYLYDMGIIDDIYGHRNVNHNDDKEQRDQCSMCNKYYTLISIINNKPYVLLRNGLFTVLNNSYTMHPHSERFNTEYDIKIWLDDHKNKNILIKDGYVIANAVLTNYDIGQLVVLKVFDD